MESGNWLSALTAGPFIAAIVDAVEITIYFQIAVILLNGFRTRHSFPFDTLSGNFL